MILFLTNYSHDVYNREYGKNHVNKATLQNRAYEFIKNRIICCDYQPGSMLNEELLCNVLNISRTPVREAIGKLEQDGLLEVKPKKGILVKPISIEDINNVFELRILYETYAIKKYGYTIPAENLYSYYQRISGQEPSSVAKEVFYTEDDELHEMFISAIHNHFILQSYRAVTVQNNRIRYMTGLCDNRIEETRMEHIEVLKLCIENSWQKASEAMERHLQNAKKTAFAFLLDGKSLSTGICSPVVNKVVIE